ncbi:hypothetical protein [Nocardiopsis sp. NPDC057823]|uniref:hypothetical protein n=1 Tax=Nocardiopsis sp. NPDC057823 TaxID=3346256 RepID=UPI003672BCA9
MKVVVDRDSVSMGDDVEPHARVWKLPDDTRVGEVVARMAGEYLPRSGGCAWTVEALHGAEAVREDGAVVLLRRGGRATPCAFVAYPEVGALDAVVAPSAEVRAVVVPTPIGEYAFHTRHHPRGRPVPLTDYLARAHGRTP